ncbi:26S proteasome non-ATPase regulatory subunit 1 [Hylaeus anthracinus]|uniref:26S proteasome non-ATPase regulatory subunit 1 n=1 Tax=Hylaeus anthracinus TaxID=313031 RepID=UPI0023B8BF6F|nr:26S proteasome non-ATPase regulatory subunit 1 [Hylaeus anthracinus]
MKTNMNITSAAGIISLLEEPMPELKVFALKKLDMIVDEFWPEISEAIEKIEILHEDKAFPQHDLAALVASKVYYHLGSFEDSLTYALGAADLFDVNARNEYVDTTIAKCIDFYTQQRVLEAEGKLPPGSKGIDPRLEGIVNRMFQRCLDDNQYRQALGLALETRRMDIFEAAIMQSDDVSGMLSYAFQVVMSLIQNRGFRNTVLRCLVSLYRNLGTPDYVNMCQCLIFLDDPLAVAELLDRLSKGSQDCVLMAYQIAFDLYESATQQFLGRVLQALRAMAPIPGALIVKPIVKPAVKASTDATSSDSTSMETETSTPAPEEKTERSVESLNAEEREQQERVDALSSILGGEISIDLHLQFLIRSNHTDMLILKNTKDAIRVSICHTATVIANAYMHSGTTSDQFLRDNLEWLARATNWAKLTATASLGVIHRGHEQEALALMQSYLPRDAGAGAGYSEGGGLYALGLIHANHGAVITDYLLGQLKDAQNEMVRHGGCLGLGLAAMGSHRQDVYEQLKFNLYQDDAVTGEAAGIAMGMVMLGSKSTQAIEDMVAYAQETQHEKILRGLAVGIAFTMYGRLEEADPLVTSLCADKDPILRRSGMYTLAMAYCGTGNNQAIRKLLHVAVSDVNDDVRRAAVTGLGFLLFRTPEQCPSVVSLLAESYNPHVRYGAAMALGIACAGTGLKEAITLLDPMTNDPVNFVRQGALIASAMILIQQTEATCPRVKDFRALYAKVVVDKHEDVMAKFGAILAQGIIDAGGRNVTVSLQSRTGHTNMLAVVGALVFTQYWYWFPLAHCLALAFTPTCLIALNSQLKMPKLEIRSNARPSVYAYPAPLEEKKREEREKVTTAVLSIAARARRRESERRARDSHEKMDVDPPETKTTVEVKEALPSEKEEKKKEKEEKDEKTEKTEKPEKTEKAKESKESTKETKEKVEKGEKKGKDEPEKGEKEKKEPEPNFENLQNPARVLRQQLKVIQLVEGSQYVPVKDLQIGGIVMVKHIQADTEEELVEPVAAFGPKPDEEKEADPPEPFEFTETFTEE